MDITNRLYKGMILLALATIGCQKPSFQVSTESPILVQSSIVLSPNASTNRLVSFAKSGTQLVFVSNDSTLATGDQLRVWWYNIQTAQVDQKAVFVLPHNETFVDATLSTQNPNTFLVLTASVANFRTVHQYDIATGQISKSTNITKPMGIENATFEKMRFGSDSVLIGMYRDRSGTAIVWTVDTENKNFFSRNIGAAYASDSFSNLTLSADQKSLLFFNSFSQKISRFQLMTGLPETSTLAPDSVRNVKSLFSFPNDHLGVVINKNDPLFPSLDQFEYIELNNRFEIVASNSIPMYILPALIRSKQDTVDQMMMDPGTQTIALQTSSPLVFLWDIATQTLKPTQINLFQGPLKAVAPVGEEGMITIDSNSSGTSNVYYWEWNHKQPWQHMHSKAKASLPAIPPHPFATAKNRTALLAGDKHLSMLTFMSPQEQNFSPLGTSTDVFATTKALAAVTTYGATEWWGISTFFSKKPESSLRNLTLETSADLPVVAFDIMTLAPNGSCIAGASQSSINPLEIKTFCSKQASRNYGWESRSTWTNLTGTVEHLLWSPGGEWVFGSDSKGNAVIWGVFTYKALQHWLLEHQSPVAGAIWLDDNTIAFVQQNGTLTLQSAIDGSVIYQQQLGLEYADVNFAPTDTGAVGILLAKDRLSIQRIHITKQE